MKKAFLASISMIGIIAVRMILSVTFTDQVGEIFSRIATGILFYYFICSSTKNKSKTIG